MGKHCAHHVSELPPALQARLRRILDAPPDGLTVSSQDVAEAAAELALPVEPKQSTLKFSPDPSASEVYEAAKYTKNDAG